jgi:phenylpropionate dioxygenase-like ring-hydroxylating dioxygenase large terminal subunit
MFKIRTPKFFAHISALDKGNLVLPDFILNKKDDDVNLMHRFCPHRMYPLETPGKVVQDVWCKFHNFRWDKDGNPINNDKKLHCGKVDTGRSGMIFKDFVEPDHKWVDDLASEKSLVYHHALEGTSKGSWMWLLDAEADLLHVYEDGIHPFLSRQVKLEDIQMDQGDGWILQSHPTGWWLYVFPFLFIEYSPGCVMVNNVIPDDINTEFGFKWISQFYYDPSVDATTRRIFETCEEVFREDVATAELQKGKYFPLMKAMNRYEDHCVHLGDWYRKNVNKE